MTGKISAKKVLLAGLESTYALDPMLTGTNGMLASNFTLTPMASTVLRRQLAYPNFGSTVSEYAAKYATIQFDVECAGSGAAGTAPVYGPLLRACGLTETVHASGGGGEQGARADYTPRSSGEESAAEYFFWDGLRKRLLGSRGTCSLKASGAALPMWTFNLTGLYQAMTDTAAPDVSSALAAFLHASEVNLANTTFSLFGVNVVMDTLQIDLGNTVTFRDRPNAAYVGLTDRAMTGSVTIEAPAIATLDVETAVASKTLGALQLIQGTTGGNIIEVDAPQVQLGAPTYTDLNGVLGMTIPLTFIRTVGDDEIRFTVR